MLPAFFRHMKYKPSKSNPTAAGHATAGADDIEQEQVRFPVFPRTCPKKDSARPVVFPAIGREEFTGRHDRHVKIRLGEGWVTSGGRPRRRRFWLTAAREVGGIGDRESMGLNESNVF